MGRKSFNQRAGWDKNYLGRMAKSINAIIMIQWGRVERWKLCDGKRHGERERENLKDGVVVNETLQRVRVEKIFRIVAMGNALDTI